MHQNFQFDNRKHMNKPMRARSQSPNFYVNSLFNDLFTSKNIITNQDQINNKNENNSASSRDQSPTTANFKKLSLNSPVTIQVNSIKNKRKSPLIEIDTNPRKKNLTGYNLINEFSTCQVLKLGYTLLKIKHTVLLYINLRLFCG